MLTQTAALAIGVVTIAVVQYVLTVRAVRDLLRRPKVRYGNKVGWGFLILCLPIMGAILYEIYGPVGFRPRPAPRVRRRRPTVPTLPDLPDEGVAPPERQTPSWASGPARPRTGKRPVAGPAADDYDDPDDSFKEPFDWPPTKPTTRPHAG